MRQTRSRFKPLFFWRLDPSRSTFPRHRPPCRAIASTVVRLTGSAVSQAK
jgi:hypothetical protein